ncbi:hypothetical protein CK203_075643 [Vitis vinifera]|uniref:Uncharacterized protein n=1 Tax=Vitis vinifera TaxID=29760 RepID=A0A438EGR0_VITVI|nr:hypothetical protein CK203_075643 [Vitis vinifera]
MGSVLYVEDLVAELGCRRGKLLIVYLGLPLGDSYKSTTRGHSSTRGWVCGKDGISLRAGGLLSSKVLSQVYPFITSLFPLANRVSLRIETIQRECLQLLKGNARKVVMEVCLENESLKKQVVVGKYGAKEGVVFLGE